MKRVQKLSELMGIPLISENVVSARFQGKGINSLAVLGIVVDSDTTDFDIRDVSRDLVSAINALNQENIYTDYNRGEDEEHSTIDNQDGRTFYALSINNITKVHIQPTKEKIGGYSCVEVLEAYILNLNSQRKK